MGRHAKKTTALERSLGISERPVEGTELETTTET
jgi:hypothetical protein